MTAEELGLRVQEVLDELTEAGQREAAEELVRTLMDFYGAGLGRMAALLPAEAFGDELVAGLLVLHDLHPQDVPTRIGHALAAVPGWEVQRFDAESGELTLRQDGEGGGCGCGGAQDGARLEEALACFAPEVTAVELARQPTLLQIGTRPVAEVR
ncbi:thioredoxin [Kitasatospora sp. NBC_01287]|uniref:thioredoxin n=1 Tax=Kitasatospora sp. NBC_01287 TaxID=2903573 RepID=UPI00224F69BD|nr:thioredoxin [Kitasatospora sp. NBC_01287]MCX4744467.1 thioredoxin [Kitasatospora sp. NBC_01287]